MSISKDKFEQLRQKYIGKENYTNNGSLMKIINYIDKEHIIVEFQDEYKAQKTVTISNFKKGSVKNPHEKDPRLKDRTGEEKLNNQGCLMKIVGYRNKKDIDVEFNFPKHVIMPNCTYVNFKNGEIKNPYYPEVYGKGYLGTKYPCWIDGENTKEYNCWLQMLHRCYSETYHLEHPTYKEANCCEEWLNYENFYEWLISQPNYNKWESGYRWNIDKDILIKGNKIYSPNTSLLVPREINLLFVKRENDRGKYPIGVVYHKASGKFSVACCKNGKNKYLGLYNTVEEAFKIYKENKESVIKNMAQKYFDRGEITESCYKAMMMYKVEITD